MIHESINIGGVTLRNRVVFAPVKTGYGTSSGDITQRHLDFYRARAEGGVGAIIPEPLAIDPALREIPVQIGVYATNLSELVDVIHRGGAVAIAHLNHPGRMVNPKIPGVRIVAPSPIPCPNVTGAPVPYELTQDEIKREIAVWAEAVKNAKNAGFDAVELQFGHGYLVQQFLSPATNKRNDEYGGDRENRARFAFEVLEAVRSAVGHDFPIIVRISADEKFIGGYGIEDGVWFAAELARRGVNAIHVSSGSACESPPWYFQHMAIPTGEVWLMAKRVREAVDVPVIAVGRIRTPEDAEKIIKNGMADIVALGRPLVADPDLVRKSINGITVRKCSACLDGCLFSIKSGKGLRCTINPWVGNEGKALPDYSGMHFVVVGGGPAGMTAAELLRMTGAKVTLFERNRLGGNFNLAYIPKYKQNLKSCVEYLVTRMKELDVEIVGKEASIDDVAKLNPDGVFVATGAVPIIPKIEGIDKNFVYTGLEVLKRGLSAESTLVIGGGMIGMEVAEFLADSGAGRVVVVELLDDIARDMEPISRALMLKRIKNKPIEIFLEHKVTRIEDGFVEVSDKDGRAFTVEVELVAVAVGLKPEASMAEALGEAGFRYAVIGDAAGVGKAVDAVRSAFDAVVSF